MITERNLGSKCFILFLENIRAAVYPKSPLLCIIDGIKTTQPNHKDERTAQQPEVSFMLLLALDNLEFCDVPDVNIVAV